MLTQHFHFQNENISPHTQQKCTRMFIWTAFIMAKREKQSRFPSTDEWIYKSLYNYTIE